MAQLETVEQLIKRRDALASARFQGARVVQFADRMVTFRSDAEMAQLIAILDRQIRGDTPVSTVRITSSKGL